MLWIVVVLLLDCSVLSSKNDEHHPTDGSQCINCVKNDYDPFIQLYSQLYEEDVDARLRHAEKVLELWQMAKKTQLPLMYISEALPLMIKEVWGNDNNDPYSIDEEKLVNGILDMINEVQQAEWLGLPSPDILKVDDP